MYKLFNSCGLCFQGVLNTLFRDKQDQNGRKTIGLPKIA